MKIAVIGPGTWGTALAQVLADNNHEVYLYGIEKEVIEEINEKHTNNKYFENVKINEKIKATLDLEQAVKNSNVILLTVPTSTIRSVLEQIKPLLTKKVIFVNASKGFDPKTNQRMSETIREVIDETLRYEVVSLIGPSHAEEVIIRMLTCICSVSIDNEVSEKVQNIFANEYFRVYSLNDEIGAEYGVAIKNIMAIAAGILSGYGYGDNTRAALMTRGLAEMVRYGMAKGGELSTYLGLTGIGDLIVTCTSIHSRNFQLGYKIALENDPKKVVKESRLMAEGLRSCKVIYEDLVNYDFDMPIVSTIYDVLYNYHNPLEKMKELMIRPLKSEY